MYSENMLAQTALQRLESRVSALEQEVADALAGLEARLDAVVACLGLIVSQLGAVEDVFVDSEGTAAGLWLSQEARAHLPAVRRAMLPSP